MGVGAHIHYFGVFILFVASILLLFITISAPIINGLGLLEITLGNSTKSHDYGMVFGTFGYCCTNCAPNSKDDICTGRHIGYEPAQMMARIDGTDYDDISSGTSDSFTRVMVLHPIACGTAFIAFLISIGGGVLASLLGALAAFVAWVLVVIVMATDFTLFGIIRHHVNDDDSNSKARFGDAIWLLVASFILLFAGMCIVLFTCCVSRREKKRSSRAFEKQTAPAPATGRKGRLMGFLKH
ncbi:hypothetical protein AC578_8390 [Pseudocercospora eumusae]|uniref:Pali-domain-containing protein n=1 Tax=Pseudocercospora eumusae TaxID=321146 RepID=A0A139HRV2_9PEZI|nr:hypothetical protein AC578_8390 [Pseudocercospora eumusae]